MLRTLANGWNPGSMAGRFRRKRFQILLKMLSGLPTPVKILDVGGVDRFWLAMDMSLMPEHHVTFLNLYPMESALPHSTCIVGDGRNLERFRDGEFDLVISNSVIEHVGNLREQRKFAWEVARVGKAYFVQTPSRFFPVEPHFLLPFFQYYPLGLRARLHQHFDLGWWKKAGNYFDALEEVESIRLLSGGELGNLFPGGTLYRERFGPLTKSYVIYHFPD